MRRESGREEETECNSSCQGTLDSDARLQVRIGIDRISEQWGRMDGVNGVEKIVGNEMIVEDD